MKSGIFRGEERVASYNRIVKTNSEADAHSPSPTTERPALRAAVILSTRRFSS